MIATIGMVGLFSAGASGAAAGSALTSWPFGVGAGGITLAVLAWFLKPGFEAYLRERADREKARLTREREQAQEGREGWKAAMASQQTQIEAQKVQLEGVQRAMESLQKRITELESEVTTERRENIRLSGLLDHANSRVTELETSWPPNFTMPSPRRPID